MSDTYTLRAYTIAEVDEMRRYAMLEQRLFGNAAGYDVELSEEYRAATEDRVRTMMVGNVDPATLHYRWVGQIFSTVYDEPVCLVHRRDGVPVLWDGHA